jgi:hypothetical protein
VVHSCPTPAPVPARQAVHGHPRAVLLQVALLPDVGASMERFCRGSACAACATAVVGRHDELGRVNLRRLQNGSAATASTRTIPSAEGTQGGPTASGWACLRAFSSKSLERRARCRRCVPHQHVSAGFHAGCRRGCLSGAHRILALVFQGAHVQCAAGRHHPVGPRALTAALVLA